jgi:hypothetical protein
MNTTTNNITSNINFQFSSNTESMILEILHNFNSDSITPFFSQLYSEVFSQNNNLSKADLNSYLQILFHKNLVTFIYHSHTLESSFILTGFTLPNQL